MGRMKNMLNLSWKIFCLTGSVDSYLLIKKMEKENEKRGPERNTANVKEKVR